jgi:hypothetical protein
MTMSSEPETLRAERQIRLAVALPQCDGLGLKHLVQAGLTWLETNHKAVNALNVFPVPDGDTGTNMLMTMQAAYREIADSTEPNVSQVAHAVAHGALMGARGNSGVILSQIWRGFARGLGGRRPSPPRLAPCKRPARLPIAAWASGRGHHPTVTKDTAAAAAEAAARPDLRQMSRAGRGGLCPVAHPDLMPSLKQAGVVDSGGKGLAIIMEGILATCAASAVLLAPEVMALDRARWARPWTPPSPAVEVADFARAAWSTSHRHNRLADQHLSAVGGARPVAVHIHLPRCAVTRRLSWPSLARSSKCTWRTCRPGGRGRRRRAPNHAPGAPDGSPWWPCTGIIVASWLAGRGAIVSAHMNPSTEASWAIGQVAAGRVIVATTKNIILAAQRAAESVKPVAVVPARRYYKGWRAASC